MRNFLLFPKKNISKHENVLLALEKGVRDTPNPKAPRVRIEHEKTLQSYFFTFLSFVLVSF